MKSTLSDFVEGIYQAQTIDEAFSVMEAEVLRLGFDGVLYTYIPRPMIDAGFSVHPVYKVSEGYNRRYLAHYADARFERVDPLIRAISEGERRPISWWGPICHDYRDADRCSDEVIAVSRDYGVQHGLTIPLMSDGRGIAGASVISENTGGFDQLVEDRLEQLNRRLELFHGLVFVNIGHLNHFVRPLTDQLSDTEMGLVSGLVAGRNTKCIASDLDRSEGYLEQVMMSVRRKWTGDDRQSYRSINRNQLVYYAGLLNLLDTGETPESGSSKQNPPLC